MFNIAYAQGTGLTLERFMINLNTYILNPIITTVFVISLVYFMWGVIKFLYERQNGATGEEGKKHLLYGIIGMFIMSSVYGILQLLANSIGAGANLFK